MNNWPTVPLGEVLHKSEDWIQLHPDRTYKEVTVRLWGKGATLRKEIAGAEIASATRLQVHANQFIISRIDARNGASGLIPEELEGAVVSNDFPVFTPNPDRLDPHYLGWLSKTKGFVELCKAASEGTTNRVRLKEERFLATQIALPPLPEQRRLVERIDALAAKIGEAKGLRKVAEQESEYLVPGRVAQLLADTGGETARICEIADVRGGIQKSPDRAPGSNPVRYLTVAHVHRDRIRVDDPRFFEVSPHELDRWRLQAGDVLIIEGNGSADQIGRTALFRGELDPCVHQNHVIRIRPDQRIVNPEFLNLYLNSPVGQEAVQTRSRTTSGLRSLSVGRIKEIEIRIPDLVTQSKVVHIAAEFKDKYQHVIQIQADTSKELNAMLPAILDQAFRGEL